MAYFKFRSISNWKWLKAIFDDNSLYASSFSKLNDPMEGYYYHSGLSKEELSQILEHKNSYRICSLSKTSTDVCMWAFYGDSGKGVCLEVEPVGNSVWKGPLDVNYVDDLPSIESLVERLGPFEAIENILNTKLKRWETEQEIRFLNPAGLEQLPIIIKKVILGYNISDYHRKKIKRLVSRINKDRFYRDIIVVEEMSQDCLTY